MTDVQETRNRIKKLIVERLFLEGLDPMEIGDDDPLLRHDQFATYLYFSFITLTSVGFGDIRPATPAAQSLTMFCGIYGQLYFAILVAKLVGIYTARSINRE